MRRFTKLPLYLGLMVLVVSVLISAVKVGQQQSLVSQTSQANISRAALSLSFTPPNLATVFVSSDKEIAGADVTLKLTTDQLTVLPSSLNPGPSFLTSGGIMDEANMTFSFTALAKKPPVTAGIVGTFTLKGREGLGGAKLLEAGMSFLTSNNSTSVIDKSGKNILVKAEGLNFSLSTK